LATAIAKLPDQQAAALGRAYAQSVSAKRMKTLAVLAILAVLIVISAQMADVRPAKLVANIGNFGSYIVRTLPTITFDNFFADIRAWYWNFGGWFRLLVETILIAYLGTFLGGILAFCLCFFAAANLVRNKTTLIFVIAFGLGPMAGVLALTIHTVGALGKLFAEVVENIDMKPVEGLSATGASWLQIVRFGVLPQVSSGFASYGLLRFEINVRGAGVMGFVGAGGIGQEFLIAIRNFYYTDVSAILLMIIVTVILIDLGTERIRHRLIGMERMR
jgi:phosphonate transport system permease protein